MRDEIETQKRMKTEIFRQRESVMQDHRKQTASKKALEAKIKTLNAQREQLRGQLAELRSAEEQYVPPVDFWVRCLFAMYKSYKLTENQQFLLSNCI